MITPLVLFLALLAVSAIVGFFAWTAYIALMQKRAWRAFAAAHGLRYTPGPLMECPHISGTYGGLPVALFGSEHVRDDGRGARKRMAVEVSIPGTGPTPIILASGEMVRFARALGEPFGPEFAVDIQPWDSATRVARAADTDAARAFLTPRRLAALDRLMRTPHGWVTFVLGERESIVRLDTADPMDTVARVEACVKAMVAAARVLTPEGVSPSTGADHSEKDS